MKGKLEGQKFVDKNLGNLINLFIVIKKPIGKKRYSLGKLKKVIVLKLDSIGDAILTLPMIKELNDKTKAEIIVGCSEENYFVFKNHNFIRRCIVFNTKSTRSIVSSINKLKKEKADICIDTGKSSNISAIIANYVGKKSIGFKKMENSLRDKVYDYSVKIDLLNHMSKSYFFLIEPLGIKKTEEQKLISLKIDKNIQKETAKRFKFLSKKQKKVGLHLWDVLPYKKIKEGEKVKIINYLLDKKYNIIITGNDKESVLVKETLKKIKDKSAIIDLSGKINTEELTYVISKLDLFIALDGGPMHIAASMNTPVIGVFGHDMPSKYRPLCNKSAIVYKNIHHEKYAKNTGKRHPESFNSNCLDNISAEDIKEAIKKLNKSLKG